MTKITKRYDYKEMRRRQVDGRRLYETPDGGRVPSVTTILDKTTDKTFLREWKQRIGEEKAANITRTSTGLGTKMHKMLEDYINEDTEPQGNLIALAMARAIIREGLKDVDEVWGMEVPLYYPGVYAGTTDCVGVFQGEPAIIDFKNSYKLKKREWISGYFEQLTAYAAAHNAMFETDIKQGVIMLATQDGIYQQFELNGEEWNTHSTNWAQRVEKYYELGL